MKSISDVRLGFKDQEVLVTADIDMVEGDLDDLYFVMFNILDNPLRFVVAVAGNFVDFLVAKAAAVRVGTVAEDETAEVSRTHRAEPVGNHAIRQGTRQGGSG